MKRVKFIYNPSSGENLVASSLDEVVRLYQEKGYSIVPYRLNFKADPDEMISDIDDTYHHVLIAGGDGTVNYVVNRLKRRGLDIPIAVVPAGTANDFATILGIPADIIKAVRMILDGEIRPIDLGRVNDEYFVNVFSCGLFTDVSQKTPTVIKNTFGKLAYYVNGLTELTRFRKMHIKLESDGGGYEGGSIIFFVFNGRTAGNLKIAYKSEIDDGLLDVLVIKGDNPLETVQTIMHYMPLIGGQKKYPTGIVHIQCSRLTAHCDSDETTDIDGQKGPGFPLEITCEKGGLRVLCPRTEAPAKRGRKTPRDSGGER